MTCRRTPVLVLAALVWAATAAAQTPLTLSQAVARARAQNPDAASAAATERAAGQRVTQARAGYWPRVDVAESWQRGNQPVFVFGSLLAQRHFTSADFALPALNHPNPVDNFRAAVTIEQSLVNAPARANVHVAGLGRDIAAVRREIVDHDLGAAVTGAYGRVLLAAARHDLAAAAVETARADHELAANRRDAGLATDADVLQLVVYVARTREHQIRALADERIARAELNQLMGEPLDAVFVLDRAPTPAVPATRDGPSLETEAIERRPEVGLAGLQEQLARATEKAARAAFLPQVTFNAGWELNGGGWHERASSWVVGAVARLNLFQGLADRARLAEAREQATERALARQKAETAARLDVRIAIARLEAARAREEVGRAVVAQARESRRIIRDRYEAGLTDAASLLRAAEAIVQAETEQTAAQVAVLTESAALERAVGRR